MKTHKKLAILASCAGLSVLLVGTSACSLIASAIYGEFGSKGTSVIGTHTMTMSDYNKNWFTDGSTSIDVGIANEMDGMGCVNEQVNTLILNKDGTYQLTKRLDIDVTDAWSFLDGYYEYSYYGTYTYSGSTVTLSKVETITYTTENFDVSSIIKFGKLEGEQYNKDIVDYNVEEQTTEISSPSGFVLESKTTTVIDLWYGAYLYNTGKGNVEQTVTIGSYDWGDFTFSDDGLST